MTHRFSVSNRLCRRRLMTGLAGTAVALLTRPELAHAAGGSTRVEIMSGPAFGAGWRMLLPATGDAENARAAVETIIARIDARLSPFRPGSDLTLFNAGHQQQLSPDTRAVTEAALHLAKDSGGAFDPTAAPIGRRYGFGPPAIAPDRPAGQYDRLYWQQGLLRSRVPGLTLDLCGLAKGYALDLILAQLHGLDCMIELGGEIGTHGRHPDGRSWRLGIQRPGSDRLQRILDARPGRALASSGDGIQGYEIAGRWYAHVVDPRHGRPLNNGVAQVSVLAPNAMLADGLATAAMVLGPGASRRLLADHHASALFLMRRPNGLVEIDVNGFVEGGPS